MTTIDYVARARSLLGWRFRPQGRSRLGVDCVGLALETYGIEPHEVRADYRLRGDHGGELAARLRDFFEPIDRASARAGDLMVLEAGCDQLHLAVMTDRGFVHAHAGLRMVVETPGNPSWLVRSCHRRRSKD